VATGVPVLTNKGRDALKTMPLDAFVELLKREAAAPY